VRLSTVAVMKLCRVYYSNRSANKHRRACFRWLHEARNHRVEAAQTLRRAEDEYDRYKMTANAKLRAKVAQRNTLPTVTLARRPRAVRVALNVDAARAPKSHALLHGLERLLLA
jgi:hypothetical protein